VHTLTIDRTDNNAWHRQLASRWIRRMFTGDTPDTWVQNTNTDVQYAITRLNVRPGNRVLDLGCGWGRHSLALAAYGLRVTGLDLSHDLLALARYNARRHGLNVNWVEADIAALPLHASFDAIAQFCGNLMTWFSDRDRAVEALWNVTNLLRPGGRFVVGSDEWQPELPARAQHWDEWDGGAAIYRQRFDRQRRIYEAQTVVFGPQHERREFRRQTWWPTHHDMEVLFEQVGLAVCERSNGFVDAPFDPGLPGLVYVLERA
jgi:SAM-dependent methyltransferase